MVKEYKDWLFVEIQEGADQFELDGLYVLYTIPKFPWWDSTTILPPGSWQIIGKGDALDSIQWMDIIEWDSRVVSEGITSALLEGHKDYERTTEDDFYVKQTATESGHSLLRSLEMEPETTIILKKQ